MKFQSALVDQCWAEDMIDDLSLRGLRPAVSETGN